MRGSHLSAVIVFTLLFTFASLYMTHTAAAHENIGSKSASIITVDEKRIDYYLNIPPEIFSVLEGEYEGNDPYLKKYLSEGVVLSTWDSICTPVEVGEPVLQESGNRIVHMVYKCPREVEDLTVESSLFFDIDDKHVHLVKVADSRNPSKFLHDGTLTMNGDSFKIADVKSPGNATARRAGRFLSLGAEHILGGYDHILFIVLVIFVTVSFGEAVKVITSFTVAHSLTLALAFFGVISLSPSIVEPLIALSIAYIAFENIFKKKYRRRWLLTFAFGLLHGLGFVGPLKEITISKEELLISLFSFNLGIEAGQILIVGILAPALYYLARNEARPLFVRWASACIGVIGFYWFIERTVL